MWNHHDSKEDEIKKKKERKVEPFPALWEKPRQKKKNPTQVEIWAVRNAHI